MQDEDKARGKLFRHVDLVEHAQDDTPDGRKQAVKKGTVLQEVRAEFICDSKNTVSVFDMDDFERHRGGSVNGVFIATSRTKAAFAAKRDKFKIAAFGAPIHGTAKRRVTTMNHLVYVFHNRKTWMKSIFNFLVMVNKNTL